VEVTFNEIQVPPLVNTSALSTLTFG